MSGAPASIALDGSEQCPPLVGGSGSRRANSLDAVRAAIENLRVVDTVEELVALAPIEAGRLGFDRCLVSRISQSRWVGRSAYAHGDEDLAEAMVEVGAHPKLIDDRLIESDLVRRRTSLLVRDAQRNERVHPELKRLVKTESYVVAPIITRTSVVGFIHADTKPDGDQVDEVDRELLAMFSTGFSMELECLFYREQLDQIRASADTVNCSASRIFGDAEATGLTGRSSSGSTPRSRHLLLQSTGGALDQLTRREIEVLIHMADGETNQRIAASLFVSEATIKAHVKNILRKLGAGNRAEAVSRYFRAI